MHEAGIAESMLGVVLKALPQADAKVTKVRVVAGALSGVVAESLAAWFEIIGRGTAAEGAAVEVRHKAASLRCPGCGYAGDFDGSGPVEPACPRCGGTVRLEGGADLYVDSIEVTT